MSPTTNPSPLATVARLTDRQLVASLLSLRGEERRITAEVLLHLGEVEERRIHIDQGHPSLFAYCREVMGYSESTAGRRIAADRAARGFPVLYEMLARGEVSLCVVAMVSSLLTDENHAALLVRICGKSAREVEVILAEYRPKEKVRDRHEPSRRAERREQRRKRKEEKKKERTERTRDSSSRIAPNVGSGSDARMACARVDSPSDGAVAAGNGEGKRGSRHIPAALRDAVWVRDGGRCTFVSGEGRRCQAVRRKS